MAWNYFGKLQLFIASGVVEKCNFDENSSESVGLGFTTLRKEECFMA